MTRRIAMVLILLAAALSHAVSAAPATSRADHLQRLDDFLDHVETGNGGAGSLSIFRGDEEIYARSFGQKNLHGAVPDATSKYQIASVTKMVTAILAFRLIEAGRLRLDQPLSDFHPDMPSARTITIANLLEHSSGLGNFAIRDGAVWVVDALSRAQILGEIRRQGVAFEPGDRVAYSNSAYFLLTTIIERTDGRDYHQIVAQDIAGPLGLKNFASTLSNPNRTLGSHVFAGQWKAIKDVDYANVIGVGDIASTTRDLNALMSALFRYRLLRRDTVEEMKPVPGKGGWGKGLAEFRYGERRFLGHGGDVLGSHARLIYNLEDEVSISYATNGERIPADVFLETIVSIVYGDDVVFPDLR
ncbi:serine hydrolase domain-containing protein [Dokdonella sp. MW10]|uniref:serine hydrolase domain-containing protein n=1 Tax=Dokdonella sp. MW10 TaxID=2992926 RepID=UPI003F80C59A